MPRIGLRGWLITAFWGMALVCLAQLLLGCWDYRKQQTGFTEQARERSGQAMMHGVHMLGAQTARQQQVGEELLEVIESGELEPLLLEEHLRGVMAMNPELFAVGMAFQPERHLPGLRLYAPYFVRDGARIKRERIDDHVDYSIEEYTWYHQPLGEGAGWYEPDRAHTSDTLVATWSTPFRRPDSLGEGPDGVLLVQVAVEDLLAPIEELELDENGYAMLLSSSGRLLRYPIRETARAGLTIQQLAARSDNKKLGEWAGRALGQDRHAESLVEPMQGRPAWISSQRVQPAGWTLAVVLSDHDVLRAMDDRRKRLMALVFWFMGLVVNFSFVLVLRTQSWNEGFATAKIAFISLVCVVGIGATWGIALGTPVHTEADQEILHSRAGLKEFTNSYTQRSIRRYDDIPVFLPTGVFVQSIEFPSETLIRLTGYVWQRYREGVHDGIERGVIFPEAVSATVTEAYKNTDGNTTTVGWYFELELRDPSNFALYPLDHKRLGLRMWHRQFYENIVLVPDLNAYDVIAPASLPGTERTFSVAGWTLESSYFGYEHHQYPSNFGVPSYVGQDRWPELYFNVVMRRDFLGPFVSNLVPLIVVAMILFIVVMSGTLRSERLELLGFNTSAVLSITAALFFGVLISHIELRGSIPSKNIFYLEYFFFVMYALIMVVSVNSILFTAGWEVKVLRYRDNLVLKAGYWPLLLISLFLITVKVFY